MFPAEGSSRGFQEGVGRRGVHPVRVLHDKKPAAALTGPKCHPCLEFSDRPDLDELAFCRNRDDIGMVLCSAFGRTGQVSQGGSSAPQFKARAKTAAAVLFPIPSIP